MPSTPPNSSPALTGQARRGRSKAGAAQRKPGLIRRLFGGLFGLGVFVVVVVFLLGYVSAYLPPSLFWWTGIFASVLPFTTVLAIFATGLGVAILGRKWLLVLGVVLLLSVLRFLPISRILEKRQAPAEGDLVVMTYNAPVRGPNPDTLSSVTVNLVREVEPDILALQEPAIWIDDAGKRRATPHVQALIDRLGYWAPTPLGRGSRHTMRQPVVARFEMGPPVRYLVAADPSSNKATHITRVPFTWEGRQAVLYNVHLHTTGEQKPWNLGPDFFNWDAWKKYLRQYRNTYLRRATEAKRLREFIERERVPVIVTGDFNSTVHGWEVRHATGGLTDAFRTQGSGWGATYHARFPVFRIDHILVSEEWEVVNAYVPDTPSLSDHRPLVARLRWRKSASP